MCGRFTLAIDPQELAQAFDLAEALDEFPSRYNIAPSQPIAAILKHPDDLKRHFQLLKWGLIPSWAKDPSIGNRLINARGETVSEKPSFRAAFKRRRCLIPATGFYEWQKHQGGKQPFYIRLQSQQPFAFAGLWETWQDIDTCTIITTEANEELELVHNRMPVILHPEDYDTWLDPDNQDTAALQSLLLPFPSEAVEAYPVSSHVNKPANDSSECIAPSLVLEAHISEYR